MFGGQGFYGFRTAPSVSMFVTMPMSLRIMLCGLDGTLLVDVCLAQSHGETDADFVA